MVDAYALFNKALNNPKEITDSMFAVVGNLAAGEVSSLSILSHCTSSERS